MKSDTALPALPPTPSSALPPTPPRATRRGAVLIGLVLLAVAGGLFAVRGPLMMAAPACASGRWEGCFGTFNGVVLMTLVTVPLAVLVAWAAARRRRAAGVAGAWRLSLAEVGMVHGTLPFLWMTMMPGSGAGVVPPRLSLVPLRDLVAMGTLGIVGNLLVFASLGFFAPVRFAALASPARILALGAGCSVLVETAQYVLPLDRVTSVDDVLVNATGAVLAGLASRRWWRARGDGRAPRTCAVA
ncbi:MULTISPECIES: VanZ family protein [unclassified Streptomyces]|uniref:VanZ family protein n=1 Tax=unclassified Streptomyces TaxID=2593676 RepID=UPI00332517AA